MDKKLEQQLRKACFYTLAGQLERITGSVFFTTSDICTLIKCSRPTAKKFMENLIDQQKATGGRDKRGALCVMLHYGAWTTKEVDSSHFAYKMLAEELTL